MLIHLPTNTLFMDRHQAINLLGTIRFDWEWSKGAIQFVHLQRERHKDNMHLVYNIKDATDSATKRFKMYLHKKG